MKDFTISYPQGVKSFGNFMKVLTLFTVAALFQITQVQAQEPAQADQSVQKMLTSPGVYVGEGDPEAGWDPEAAAIKTSDFNMDARDFTTPLPNPDLSTNIACGDLRVTFVLDKSGSILTRNGVEQVRESTLALAQVFFGTDARVSVIEFDSQARVINLGGGAPVPSVGYVVDQTFLDNLETYLYDGDALGQFYDPQSPDNSEACPTGYTNWEDALLKSAPFDPNLVLFVTDGDPNTYNTSNACGYTTSFEPALEASIVAANALKTNGAHIFVVGVSNFINVANITFISGPDQFTPQFGDIFTDDFSTTSFENLTASLSEGINAICGTELSLTKTVDFDQVCDDETITFTITVENTGTTQIDAANVVITDEFPAAFANLTIVGAPVAGAEIIGQTLTYEVGVLETGQSASIEIQANLPGANGIFLNTASADALNANSVQAEASVEKTDVVTSTLEVSACEEYAWNGETYTVSDTYTFEGTNENGCPTLETLVLTINQPTSGTETVTACGSFEWNGTVYEESGSYPFVFDGEDGKCDSTATLNLTIEPAEIIVEYVTTCGFFYQNSFGDFYFESGIYTEEYDEGELCPTEYTLYLTIATTPQPGAEPQPCYPEGSQALTGTVDENCECQPTDECDVDGGVLTITGSNQVCVGTGEEVTFDNLSLTGAVGDNSIWVLTFGNLDVIATSATGPDFDLDGLTPAANYRIRHISYADGVDINQVLADPTTEGCWDRSKSIGIGLVGAPEAATISTNSLTTVCSGEGTPKFVVASATGGTATASSVWVLTDDADNVIDYRFANSGFNLDALAAGEYRIYNVNWVTPFSPSGSTQNIADLGVCTGTSNAIEITVIDCTPGAAITSDPNPTAGASWVTFSVDKPQQVQVEVYDMAGRHISTVFKQNAAGGQDYRMQFDGTSLPNGVYMYRMTTESQVIIDKFMIAR